MLEVSRRTFVVGGVGVLVACSQSALTPAQIIADVSGAVTQFNALLPSLPSVLASPSAVALIRQYSGPAQTALAALSSALPATQGASLLQTIDGYLNAILTGFASVSGVLPPPFNLVVPAIALVAPEVEQFIGNTLGVASAPKAGRFAAPAGYTIAQARTALGVPVVGP